MKQELWITLITYLSYCIDKELYKAIDYLKTQVEVLIEQQEKQKKRILLTNNQRMRITAKAKRLSREVINLVIKFKKENPRWGYQKITDQIEYL